MTFLIGAVMAGIALFVTYASVNGVGSMFPSAGYAVMAAWFAVEVGKYAALGFALNNWSTLKTPLRATLIAFVGFIMLLTSVSVYAYLGQSYAATSAAVGRNTLELDTKTAQATELRARVAAIDRQIAEIPATATSARIRLIQQYDAERRPLAERATALDSEIVALRTGNADAESHVGIIRFLADAAAVSVDRATMWAILAVTLCLDPFAMLLNALLNRSRQQDLEHEREIAQMRASGTLRRRNPPIPDAWFDRRRGRWSAEEIRDRRIQAESRSAVTPPAVHLKPESEPDPEDVDKSHVIAHMAASLNKNEPQDEVPDRTGTAQHRVFQARALQVHAGPDVRDGPKFAASGPPSVQR